MDDVDVQLTQAHCCCSSLKFFKIAGFTFVMCYSHVHYINWSLATGREECHKEREYSHPAYSEVALSPCDLTDSACDINCCSDQVCYQKMWVNNSII
jgi:hypothetical protein